VSELELPRNLVEGAIRYGDDQHRAWMNALPSVIAEIARRRDLDLGAPYQPGGFTSWVAPARTHDGLDVVVKFGRLDTEAAHEYHALRLWDGNGAVRLYDVEEFEGTIFLAIERCVPGRALNELEESEQDEVLTALLSRLWIEPPPRHRLRSLQQMCDEWANGFDRMIAAGRSALDPGLEREGMALLRTLPSTADRNTLLCTDLHAGNVLSAQREPWLVIDPKPYVGDPTFDAVQHILNCPDRLHRDPVGLVARIAGLLDLDPQRLRLWLFARCVQESPRWPGMADAAVHVAPR
jgi:streptomycin 6-kinase